MTGRILGAILIVVGCGGFGFITTASFKNEENTLRQLLGVLDYIQCELQYRLTPLPDLCRMAGAERKNRIGSFFEVLSQELESQVSPDVSSCVQAAFAVVDGIPQRSRKALEIMGATLGRFDMEGQVRGIEAVRAYCRHELDQMSVNRDARLRSYQTLGLCAGAALAVLFV